MKCMHGSIVAGLACLAAVSSPLVAQDRLKTMPGYEQYERVARQIPSAVKSGAVAAAWVDGGQAVEYARDGRRYRFNLATRETMELGADERQNGRERPPAEVPERGRQFASARSPDGRLNAFYKDRNLWLSAADGSHELAITSDGSAATRVKYGTASWVYGEELEQQTAMW